MEKPTCSNVPAVFSFESHNIRTILVGNDPWFVAKDVADALGYAKPENAVKSHCKHAKSLSSLESGGQVSIPRNSLIIPEGDVFRLIVRSNLPTAEKFESWVMDEVLPSIRKTGSYSPAPAIPTDPMSLLKLHYDAIVQTNQRIDEVQASVEEIAKTTRLHQWQCYELKAAVTQRAKEFHEKYDVAYPMLFPSIWNYVKRSFRVATYSAIPAVKFNDTLTLVKNMQFENMADYVQGIAGGAK